MQFPNILFQIQDFLSNKIKVSNIHNDGRINSCIDEQNIIELLKYSKFSDNIKIPSKRFWYDLLIYDEIYEWIPVNIKFTTTRTPDNIGNLSLCVYSYTDYKMDFNKSYNNGKLTQILLKKLNNKEYNTNIKKDYFFIVYNKDNGEIIVNSILGLIKLNPNSNNLPFQVKWKDNKKYKCENINEKINLFISCIKTTKSNWKEQFVCGIKQLNFL